MLKNKYFIIASLNFAGLLLGFLGLTYLSPSVEAQACLNTAAGCPNTQTDGSSGAQHNIEGECKKLTPGDCPIIGYIVIFTNILSAAVGVVVVIMLVIAGIQYSSSRDNPQAVSAARQKIMNVIIALAIYMALVGFLQWIIPGGLFN